MNAVVVKDQFIKSLDSLRKMNDQGAEFWLGRDLQEPLGYDNWENFEKVIHKARLACESSGIEPENHFLETKKMVDIGSGARRSRTDWFLSRYGCYLIAMNGSPAKQQIGFAQTYFAVQTRRQELADEQIGKRVELRDRVKTANKSLNAAAKAAGVQQYGFFHDAGYRGLYGFGLAQIKKRKGLKENEELLDRAGRAELAANEFRLTQAEQMLIRQNVQGEANAIATHRKVGEEVRATIKKLGGTMPEDLPAEPSIAKLQRQENKALK